MPVELKVASASSVTSDPAAAMDPSRANPAETSAKVHINPNFRPPPQQHDGPPRATSAVHINPNFNAAARVPVSGGGGGVSHAPHVNPNFRPPPRSPASKSAGSASPAAVAAAAVHLNPKFANRPLPSIPVAADSSAASTPHINPKFLNSEKAKVSSPRKNPPAPIIDAAKKDHYHEAVAKSVAGKVFVNPNFGPGTAKPVAAPVSTAVVTTPKTVYVDPSLVKMKKQQQLGQKRKRDSPGSEKENHPDPAPPRQRKSVFKKIGNKKLVRIRKDSSSSSVVRSPPPTAKRRASAEFRKIGTKKLVRRKATPPNSSKRSPVAAKANLSWRSRFYRTPNGKKTSIMRLVTPLSLRKVRISPPGRASKSLHAPKAAAHKNNRNLYRILNPFKIDRRKQRQGKNVQSSNRAMMTPKTPSARNAHLSPKTPKSMPPPKPARTSLLQTPAGAAATATPVRREDAIINIHGIKYKVTGNGKTLNRIDEPPRRQAPQAPAPKAAAEAEPAKSSSSSFAAPRSSNPARASLMSRKVFIEGEEFVEDEDQPGTLVRSRNSMTRASITNARNRSINTILKSQARSRQYCMFFNKFGKCNKREKGVCPYIHDKEKVAVCRRFLQGSCVKEVRKKHLVSLAFFHYLILFPIFFS